WVRRHVRYLSRGPGGAGYTPHMPHQVLNNLYGDCKDQAQLLAVMLREIGLPVWLVTLGTTDDGQVLPDVPSPWGTHAILLTKIDGKEYWIDTTVALAAWDFLPRTDRDRQTYVTRDDKLSLLKTPPFTYKDYRIEQTTHLQVQPDGTSRCKRESTYHHSSAWTRRDKWLEVPPGERRRTVTAELQDAHSKARLLSIKIDEMELNDFDKPVRAEVEFEIPKHFTGELSREASVTDSPVWTWFLGYNIDVERRLPFKLPTAFESIHRYVIQLPGAFRFDGLPESKEVKSAFGFFKLKVTPDTTDPRRMEVHMHMRLEKTRIEKSEFADFIHFQDDVSKAYRVWLNVRPTTNIADAPRLEKLLENGKTADAVSLKILAKLYVDHERLADARRVLERASALFPSDRSIWELRVQATASIDDEDRLYREMVKQFPSEPRYAVALGAACVRREDHDEAKRILAPLLKHATPAVRAAAHYQLARSADRQKDPGQALKHLQGALLADSSTLASIDALLFRARVQEKLGQAKEAMATMQAAVEADPSARDALEYLVRLEIHAGLREAALDHLRRYTVAAGKDHSSLVKAADLHLELHRLEEAFDLASQARELGFQAKAQRVLGLVHFAKHEYTQAAFHLERCDLDAKALSALIESNLRLGDLDAAKRRSDTIAKTPDAGKAVLALAKSVVALAEERDRIVAGWKTPNEKQTASARRIVGRFVCAERGLAERWPTDHLERLVGSASSEGLAFAPAIALRAWLLAERGQLRKALAEADAALKLDPQNARAISVRGRVRLEQGNRKSAADDLSKATALSRRQDAGILHWYAAVLLDAGRLKEAADTQRIALTLRPNDPELREQLHRIEALLPKDANGPR
ncbi:MAG: tetratricopeptide repeat protein, partial [Planctomycetes bacterium]|nr:tetratricopeptide repeat protein [Planctomycetota bacterium]